MESQKHPGKVYIRYDKKTTRTFIYSSILILSSSKYSPSDTTHLCPCSLQFTKHLWNACFVQPSAHSAILLLSPLWLQKVTSMCSSFLETRKCPRHKDHTFWWIQWCSNKRCYFLTQNVLMCYDVQSPYHHPLENLCLTHSDSH